MKTLHAATIVGLVLLPFVGLGGPTGQTNLTESEKSALIFMREEERLALDVYTVLAGKWGERPFANIARAEQTHIQAVKDLMIRFGLDDPIADAKPGVFKNPDIQKLYTDLVRQGMVSRLEALKVGVLIEELDIYDLRRLAKDTKNPQILNVFGNLERGSRNHLRSFMQGVQRSGGTYTPKHLTKAEFDKIVQSPMERGRGGG